MLSEPFMKDPNFKRTVILVCEHHQENGTVGFVLNRPIDLSLGDVMPDLDGFDSRLFYGGPVQPDSLHYLHGIEYLEDCEEVLPGLFWGGNFESLKAMIATGSIEAQDIQFYLGYSGWTPGQLDEEMEGKSWIQTPGSLKHFIDPNTDGLWERILKEMGGKFKMISNFPEDPALN